MGAQRREHRHHQEDVTSAPAPVRRQKKHLLRRHWLSGALLCGLLVLSGYTASFLYHASDKLQQVRQTKAELEAQLQSAQRQNEVLKTEVTKMSQDSRMELAAKAMGYSYPNETVSQSGSNAPQ